MKILFVTLILLASLNAMSQRSPQNWCMQKDYSVLRFYKGDTVLITCDTVFLVNTSTYRLYADVFRNFNSKNSDVRKLAALFDQSKELYENRIHQQTAEYEALKKQFDDLVHQSQALVHQTSDKLIAVDNTLNRIDRNISNAQTNIDEAKKLIREEMRLGNKQRLKWGIGGLGVGVVITAVAFAIVN